MITRNLPKLAAGLACVFCLGAAYPSAAADIKASGYWDFNFEWNNIAFSKPDPNAVFHARQRLRTQVDVIASESLKGLVSFEIGTSNWGRAADGASIGTDGATVEVRYSYLDWRLPDSGLKARIGLQNFALPYFVADSPVLDDDGAGLTLSYPVNDNVGLTLFWMRATNDNNPSPADRNVADASDFFGLTLPVTGDGWRMTPWAVYANLGGNSLKAPDNSADIPDLREGLLPYNANGATVAAKDAHSPAWWLGLGGDVKTFAPFRFAADLAYGKVDWGRAGGNAMELSRAGWLGVGLAEYKLDSLTPGLIFWYGSGDNSNPGDGSERMPAISPGWEGSTLGWDGEFGIADGASLNDTPIGTWGIIAQLADMSFLENLSHTLALGYYTGTNSTDMATTGAVTGIVSGNAYLTTRDHAWEADFNTRYQICEELPLVVELNYLRLDPDKDVWGSALNHIDKNAYKAGVNLRYVF